MHTKLLFVWLSSVQTFSPEKSDASGWSVSVSQFLKPFDSGSITSGGRGLHSPATQANWSLHCTSSRHCLGRSASWHVSGGAKPGKCGGSPWIDFLICV